jgi:hypothetical protein
LAAPYNFIFGSNVKFVRSIINGINLIPLATYLPFLIKKRFFNLEKLFRFRANKCLDSHLLFAYLGEKIIGEAAHWVNQNSKKKAAKTQLSFLC